MCCTMYIIFCNQFSMYMSRLGGKSNIDHKLVGVTIYAHNNMYITYSSPMLTLLSFFAQLIDLDPLIYLSLRYSDSCCQSNCLLSVSMICQLQFMSDTCNNIHSWV